MRARPAPFLDANVLLRHLLGDHPEHSPRSTALVEAIEAGHQQVRTSALVIFETVFTLDRTYRQPRERIREGLLSLLALPGIRLAGKAALRRAFDIYVQYSLPFGDAYHAALMERLGIDQVISFDRDFDRLPGIERIEP